MSASPVQLNYEICENRNSSNKAWPSDYRDLALAEQMHHCYE